MADNRRHDEDGGFKKTFVTIAIAHLVLLGGLLLFGLWPEKKKVETVVWMNPGSFGGNAAPMENSSQPNSGMVSPPATEEPKEMQQDEPEEPPKTLPPATPPPAQTPVPTPPPVANKSELPMATPKPTPPSKPKPKPTPKVTPKPSATPKPNPKSTKSKPKSRPKKKTETKKEDSPKPKAPPTKSKKSEKADDNKKPKSSPTPHAKPTGSSQDKPPRAQPANESGSKPSTGLSSGNESGTGQGNADLAGYGAILQTRFYAAWNQPMSEMTLGKKLEVTVKLHIEADGTVTEFTIVQGSGNAVVDESVREAGAKLGKLPPPPNGQAFSAPVRFELRD